MLHAHCLSRISCGKKVEDDGERLSLSSRSSHSSGQQKALVKSSHLLLSLSLPPVCVTKGGERRQEVVAWSKQDTRSSPDSMCRSVVLLFISGMMSRQETVDSVRFFFFSLSSCRHQIRVSTGERVCVKPGFLPVPPSRSTSRGNQNFRQARSQILLLTLLLLTSLTSEAGGTYRHTAVLSIAGVAVTAGFPYQRQSF